MVDRSVPRLPPDVAPRKPPLLGAEHKILRPTPSLGTEKIVTDLRANIRSGKLSSDKLLQQIVEAARSLTLAQGAAIAMRQNNSVFCKARAGHMAPDLGSELSADSGISGQCLRTGAALRCDDTNTDQRVDVEACRRLGLRSLAVAPIGKGPTVSGVLEAFSAKPYTFDDTAMRLLEELAELAVPRQPGWSTSAVLNARPKPASSRRNWPKGILIVVASAVLAFAVWLGLRGKKTPPNPSAAQQPPASTVASGPSAVLAVLPAEPAENTTASLPRGVVMASTNEKTRRSESAMAQRSQPSELNGASTVPSARRTMQAPKRPSDAAATPPPLTVISAATNPVFAEVVPPSSAYPMPAMKLSQGVSGGTIEREVIPTYPPQALRLGLEGRVVLEAVVTEEGAVRDLKVIDGHPLLASAAMDAVAQWHYRPYRLNGQPIRMTTEITLIFKRP